MKLLLSLLLIVMLCNLLYSQTELQMGLYPKGRFVYVNKNAFPNQGGTEFLLHFKPGILVRNQDNAIIGKYSHSIGWSDFEELPLRRSFHLSYRRYFVNEFRRFKWSEKLTLFAEVENILQDWAFGKNGVVPLDTFKAWNISPMIGFELYFFGKFKFESAYGYRFYPQYVSHPDLSFAIMYKIR